MSQPLLSLTFVMSLAALTAACTGPEHGEPDSDLAGRTQAFETITNSYQSLTRLMRADLIENPPPAIKVCLEGDTDLSLSSQQRIIRDAIMKWVNGAAPVSSTQLIDRNAIVFDCQGGRDLRVNWSKATGRASYRPPSRTLSLFKGDGARVALHEFGHVFGLGDTYVEGLWSCKPGQEDSVMCGDSERFAELQPDDIRGIQEVFCSVAESDCKRIKKPSPPFCQGGELHVGDFDRDFRDDMLCHEADGSVSLDYAAPGGEFGAEDWAGGTLGFCTQEGARVDVGDFDGDRHDDLVCHEPSGVVSVQWSLSGRFRIAPTPVDLGFCTDPLATMHVADFNGDGRDDLLCDDHQENLSIVFGQAQALFSSIGWTTRWDFCTGATEELTVGDFDGGGRADLLCRDTALGVTAIALASPTYVEGAATPLFVESYRRDPGDTTKWCTRRGARLLVSDFNGDRHKDLLCQGQYEREVALSAAGGTFPGPSWVSNNGWCTLPTQVLKLGDFDGDRWADQLCYDTGTGLRTLWLGKVP